MRHLDKSAAEKFRARLKLNLTYFVSNYAVVVAGVAIVVALMHPGMIFSVSLLWSLWGLHSYLISNELVLFGIQLGTILTITQRSYLLISITAFVVIWKCLVPILFFVSISGFVILLHASTRDPKQVETCGDFFLTNHDGEDSDGEVIVDHPATSRSKKKEDDDII